MKNFPSLLSVTSLLISTLAPFSSASAAEIHLNLLREPGQEVLGVDQGKGNLVGISTAMEPQDFESSDNFYKKLDAYLNVVKSEGWISPDKKTVVAFPELIGLYLFLLDEGDITRIKVPGVIKAVAGAAQLGSFEQKVLTLFGKYPFASTGPMGAVAGSSGDFLEKVTALVTQRLVQRKAETIAFVYESTFSRLAKKYGVTIVAGSVELPDPSIETSPQGNPTLKVKPNQPLYNTSAVFSPEGKLEHLVRKVHVPGGEGFSTEALLDQVKPFSTPVGDGGVLICADSWFQDTWQQIAGVKFAVVPQYSAQIGSMKKPWLGYSLAKINHRLKWDEIRDVAGLSDREKYEKDSSGDLQKGGLTELGALLNYTAPYWGPRAGIPVTMVVPNRTHMIDKGSDTGFIVTSQDPQRPLLVRMPSPKDVGTLQNVYFY